MKGGMNGQQENNKIKYLKQIMIYLFIYLFGSQGLFLVFFFFRGGRDTTSTGSPQTGTGAHTTNNPACRQFPLHHTSLRQITTCPRTPHSS